MRCYIGRKTSGFKKNKMSANLIEKYPTIGRILVLPIEQGTLELKYLRKKCKQNLSEFNECVD